MNTPKSIITILFLLTMFNGFGQTTYTVSTQETLYLSDNIDQLDYIDLSVTDAEAEFISSNSVSNNNKKLTPISSKLKTSSLNINKSKSVKPIQLVDRELILAREFSIAKNKTFPTTQPSTTEKYPQARSIVIPKVNFSTTTKNQRKAFGPVLEF